MRGAPDPVYREDIQNAAEDVLNGWQALYEVWDNMRRWNNYARYHNLNAQMPLIAQEVIDAMGRQVQALQAAHNMLVGVDAKPSAGQPEQLGISDYFPEEPKYTGM